MGVPSGICIVKSEDSKSAVTKASKLSLPKDEPVAVYELIDPPELEAEKYVTIEELKEMDYKVYRKEE
jgi:hypothetical protein